MPIPTNYDIDRIFKLAGFPYGRPTSSRPDNYIESGANDWDILVNLFDDEQLDYLVDRVVSHSVDIPLIPGDNPVFDYLLAAELLQSVTDAGYTPLGRAFELTRVNIGDVSQDFDSSDSVKLFQSRTISTLRQRAIGLSGRIPRRSFQSEFIDTDINPAHIERRDITFENISVNSGQTIETPLVELNAGGYLGKLTFDFVINGSNQFVVYIENETLGTFPFNERIYTSSNPFATGTDDSPLTRSSIPILADSDGEIKIGFQLFGNNATLAITNLKLELFPLWGIAATQDTRYPDIPDDNKLNILVTQNNDAVWDDEIGFLTRILTTLFQDQFLGARLLPASLGADNTILRVDGTSFGWETLQIDVADLASNVANALLGTNNVVESNLAQTVIDKLLPALTTKGFVLAINSTADGVEWREFMATIGANAVDFNNLATDIQKRILPSNFSRGVLVWNGSELIWQQIGSIPAALTANRNQVLRAIVDPNDATKTIEAWGLVNLAGLANEVKARFAPTLTGNGGKFLAVNSGANAVELVDKPSGGGGGFPTTRTAIYNEAFDASTKSGGNRAIFSSNNVSENIIPNTLYEVEINSGTSYSATATRSRTLHLSPAGDSDEFEFWIPLAGYRAREISSGWYEPANVRINLDNGSTSTSVAFDIGDSNNSIHVRINKLT